MTKVGQFVTDPRAGGYCKISLDSGERIIVNHDKGGFKGGLLTIEVPKFLGLSSDRIFVCDLDSQDGKNALSFLTRDAQERSLDATPLGAFVKYLKSCQSIAEVKTRCASLVAIR
jgi:hypothetical protein